MKKTHLPELTMESPAYLSSTHLSSTYGGELYESDFCTDRGRKASGQSVIASRIINAWRFDQQCIRNSEIRALIKREEI